MNWPTFIATHHHRDTYWYQWLKTNNLFQVPRLMQRPQRSMQLYIDATPTSVRIHLHVTPLRQLYETFREALPIAEAEMAAALYGLLWKTRLYRNPFRVTLYTDSSVVFYTRYTGKGYTLRSQQLLP
jgi:hypothetical protein